MSLSTIRKTTVLLLLLSAFAPWLGAQTFLSELSSELDFQRLEGVPLVQKYGQVSAVKIVYDIRSEKLYFINAKNYKYHYGFCQRYLGYGAELAYFNEHNYRNSPERKYLLANLNHFGGGNFYVLEIAASDTMENASIVRLFQRVFQSTFIKNDLKFLLNSARLRTAGETLKTEIPVMSPSEIYKNLDYQPIGKHKGRGYLRIITDFEREKRGLAPTDIIVLDETPLFLPEVAGIIISEFQTPLSHLTILGQNRKIPIAAFKNAFSDKRLTDLDGAFVRLEVKDRTFSITRAKHRVGKKRRPRKIKLKYDLSVDSLIGIEHLDKKSYQYVGNKASNLGMLYQLGKNAAFKVPEGAFAIPFFFYQEHLQRAGNHGTIGRLLANREEMDNDSLRTYLKEVRKSIRKTPIDRTLDSLVRYKIIQQGHFTRMRFRSSTNAEDTKGFSGAGLYSSKTAALGHPRKTVEKAIKKVWASLWSYEAFMEREYFNIPHAAVYMGILVHRSFPNEAVNGVAITKNLYRKKGLGFVVNAQLGDENVVNPEPGTVSDQFICYPRSAADLYKNTIDIITTSSLNHGELVMSPVEIQQLADQLELVKTYFHKKRYPSRNYLDLGIDVEFKLDGPNRDLYIKQARIYND